MSKTSKKNAIYGQSGGVTAVINSSASGVISAWREHQDEVGVLYAAENGILGALNEELIDTSCISDDVVKNLRYTPGGAFGSCRYKLKNLAENRQQYERLIEVFAAHDIGYFLYNGGNDSADTCLKVAEIAKELGYPLQAVHIPKTIDNDLVITDNCPGFGSVAKYVATSIKEAGIDLASMYATSTKVFILEVMGRHAGWIAAGAALASDNELSPPHIILFPEITFDEEAFLHKVQAVVNQVGYCVIAVSEGIRDKNGVQLSAAANVKDDFGHAQLGGVAPILANLIKQRLNLKQHWAVADYLQRSARHIASRTDVEQAYAVGYAGVKYALSGQSSVMAYIKRISQQPYLWEIDCAPLTEIANKEKFMPRDFISVDGFHITKKCREYMEPLIMGEDYPQFKNGLPDYVRLTHVKIAKKLQPFILIK
ncbi:MAG: ATP-dependent phosphofructokinase / diphosphate-dependent phosphofructokinase [Pseudomonadota bacterium]|nr:ATP-dependent phosphofructokinase / diphosphate-dependent phosphofructokinase [Pseudomonadota bacterium]